MAGQNLPTLKQHVTDRGGSISHELKYHQAFIAHLAPAAAANLKNQFGTNVLIEEDREVIAFGKPGSGDPAQPPQTEPWGISAIHAVESRAVNRGAGVTVCVVDTGVQPDHPDLAANIAGGENFVFKKGTINPSAWADDNGHGTHVSGTIAALDNTIGVVGVAPEAKIFATKVLNSRGSGYLSDVAEGIRSCLAHGASVANMSLGWSGYSQLVHDAVIEAKNAGMVLVAAAGNESTDVSNSYPAAYPEVIAVSAVDSNGAFAYFSNFGTKIAFAAPGVSVLSTVKGSSYATYSGTSMASPHVAGVAALMISSGSLGFIADDIGLPATQQGAGRINALNTALNR
ncbi:MAG: S8 family peptidase [Deltaproteobacteria bacterium]|nr:S8 family peptidase [Deltaproteobacteria bacterium]